VGAELPCQCVDFTENLKPSSLYNFLESLEVENGVISRQQLLGTAKCLQLHTLDVDLDEVYSANGGPQRRAKASEIAPTFAPTSMQTGTGSYKINDPGSHRHITSVLRLRSV